MERGGRGWIYVTESYTLTTDDNLDDINLDSLLIQLRKEVTTKWYEFGEVAGINGEVLDNFAKSCAPDDCIVEMLDYWLRNYKGKLTWRDIATLLRMINLHQLAFDIEQVYITGNTLYIMSPYKNFASRHSSCTRWLSLINYTGVRLGWSLMVDKINYTVEPL